MDGLALELSPACPHYLVLVRLVRGLPMQLLTRIVHRRVGVLCLFATVAGLVAPRRASAEPPWVDRHVVLPEHDWAFDLGMGIAHDYAPPQNPTGVGFDFEGAVSPVDRLEIGVRTGVRIGDDGRATQADAYGRLFDRQTFGTFHDVVADPEIRVRGALLRGNIVEVGAEGRLFLPVEQGSEVGILFGVPLLFHLGEVARIDTGLYVPVVFESPVDASLSAPVDVWFQATRKLWLGPMTGFVYDFTSRHADVPLGLGLGYQVVRNVDLKAEFLFPALNDTQGAQTFGVGFGMQVRIE